MMTQQQLQQLQNQAAAASGLAPHNIVPASLPASMTGMLAGMAPLAGQQQQLLLLQQQLLAGSSLAAGGGGPSSANNSTTLNHLNMALAGNPFPADQTAMPAYLATAAAGSAAWPGTGGECSDDMLLLMQQQQLLNSGYSGSAAAPGMQQLQDAVLLDSSGFSAAGLTALQGLPAGPTDCMLPGGFSALGMTDAAGGSGSSGPKGGRPGAQAPHNPLYKVRRLPALLE